MTHVVPLGLSCRVTWQVRRHFQTEVTHPFDWWISPLYGLARYLDALDPNLIFGAGALVEQVAGGHVQSIVSREFGFSLFHDFPRVQVGAPMRVVSPAWRDHVGEARTRHERRLQRLRALDAPGNRILFVRHKPDPDADIGRTRRDLEQLDRALVRGWPKAEVWLLLVNLPAHTATASRVLTMTLPDTAGPDAEAWRGSDTEWSAALGEIGLFRAPERPDFVSPPPAEQG